MKVLGIIAEYNPFHNGHLYHLKKAKEIIKPDYTIVIMSGSFTEQGNIATYDKFTRSTLTILEGVDLVIELPTIYATSSSENFAYGAIKILNDLKIVTHIAFGSECENIETLKSIAQKTLKHNEQIIKSTKQEMKEGISSIKARDLSLKKLLNKEEYLNMTGSNNILAIQYLISLNKLKSNIIPVAIKREGTTSHIEETITKNSKYTSATSIRKFLEMNLELNRLKAYVPKNTFKLINNVKTLNNENLFYLLKYEILRIGKENIADIYEVYEGLENRIYQAAKTSFSYEELVENIKSKRYPIGRIKRILIYILLNITKEKYIKLKNVSYIKVLKINSNSKELLSIISQKSKKELITKYTDDSINTLNKKTALSLNLDFTASNIIDLLNNSKINEYYNEITKNNLS